MAFWTGMLYVLGMLLACVLLAVYRKSRARTPPKVPGHWLFKNLDVMKTPWRSIVVLEQYKPLYGDIIQLETPFNKIVMLNSPEVISEVLEKSSGFSSDRPRNVMLLELAGFGDSVGFRAHDEQHRKLRRVMASALHPAAARSYSDLHTTTSAYFLRGIADRIKELDAHSLRRTPVEDASHSKAVTMAISDSIGRFIMRMTYGHVAQQDDPLLAIVSRQAAFVGAGFARHYWVNDLPILRFVPSWMPGAQFKSWAQERRAERAVVANDPFNPVWEDVKHSTVERPSYVSKLLELKGGMSASGEDIELAKGTASSMFGAGSTTTTALVHSFTFSMCIYPDIAAQVRAEIDSQVGRDRLPILQDRDVLPYTEAVLQEVTRFWPVFPLGLQHCASQDINVRGYTIQKGTTIEGNIWSIMRDPTLYPNPNSFDPSRFLKQTPGPDPRRYIFGFGRRVCPGQHVANNGAFTMCAAFMSVFDIVASEGTMREVEKFGKETWKMFAPFGVFEPKPFGCTIKPRDEAAAVVLEACKDVAVIS